LIVPLVFCSVVSGVADLVEAKKAFGIGTRTVTYFLVASFTSSTVGTLFGLLFMGLFAEQMEEQEINATPQLTFQCLNGKFLTLMRSGDVICLANNDTAPATIFNISDSSNYFALSTTKYQRLTISDQITGILYDLVPSNIANAVSNGTVLSVISFAILFGVAVVKSFNEKTEKVNYALLLVTQCNIILQMLISFVIQFIPLAIISLIGGSLATNYDSSTELFASIGFLILALGVALGILVFFIMGGALFVTTRRNIFSYLRYMIPAQVFIMGCSSSIATLPMTMRCVDSTHEVSRSLSRFVLSLGASSNLNGTAVYMPLACIFMAKVSGLQDQLTTVKIILLIIVGAIASYGVAPVPHAGLVMVITVWRTVFGADVPSAFSILVGMDWILNRMRAIVNITNDTIIVRIIAGQCDETINYSIENDNHEYGFVLNTPPTFPESPVTESLNHHRSQTMREV
jgi:Na+/H+-dicarboxylate symporter